jgi:hypothetical protein
MHTIAELVFSVSTYCIQQGLCLDGNEEGMKQYCLSIQYDRSATRFVVLVAFAN